MGLFDTVLRFLTGEPARPSEPKVQGAGQPATSTVPLAPPDAAVPQPLPVPTKDVAPPVPKVQPAGQDDSALDVRGSSAQSSSFTEHVFTVTTTVSGPSLPSVSAEEVAPRLKRYAHVYESEPPPVPVAHQWWNQKPASRQPNESLARPTWLEPFVHHQYMDAPAVCAGAAEHISQVGPAVAKALRAMVREQRKLKRPHDDLLLSLYRVCVFAELVKTFKFAFVDVQTLGKQIAHEELMARKPSYSVIGYKHVPALGTTDIKLLREAFGEPNHCQVADVYADLIDLSISRYCWAELRKSHEFANAPINLGWPDKQAAMVRWLTEKFGLEIAIAKDNARHAAHAEARRVRSQELYDALPQAWAATRQPFIVARLETTGRDTENDDIWDFGALLCSPAGAVQAEFSRVVDAVFSVEGFISDDTGLTDPELARDAVKLPVAMKEFLRFTGEHPVFIHNLPHDEAFLRRASAATGLDFQNPTFDTLTMASVGLPQAKSLTLRYLSDLVGGPKLTHRAVLAAKATLAVLLAARQGAEAAGDLAPASGS